MPTGRRRVAALAWAAASAVAAQTGLAADYSFDLSEIEPKAYELGGFVEAKAEHFRLRSSSALFPLTFAGETPRRTLDRGTIGLELAGRYRRDIFTAYGRVSASLASDAYRTDGTGAVLEAGVRASPAQGLSFDAGKQVQRWGKGYAWNPLAFFERPKDPNDPQLSRDGFVMASADWVKSLPGPLAALGFTPVLVPTKSGVNSDYGAPGHWNPGAKLYLLYADTDIDLAWAAKGSRPQRIGFDFSRNFGSQLEVHGEWARALNATRREIGAGGAVTTRRVHADSWLLGARYLSRNDVTWIAEIYRNGSGYDDAQLAAFYELLETAFGPAGTPALQAQARALAASGYARSQPGRHYVYLRASAKDPFGWLYLTPAFTVIANLDDRSWQLTPEIVYTGWQNVEFRARAILLRGGEGSDFGERPPAHRLEFLVRLYF